MYHLARKLRFLNTRVDMYNHQFIQNLQNDSQKTFSAFEMLIKARLFSSSLCENKESRKTVSVNVLVRSIVSIVHKTNEWDSLLTRLCSISNSPITPPIAVQVIKRIKKPDLAIKFFEWLEERDGFNHDSLTYTAILKVLTKGSNPSRALVADGMLRKKIGLGFDASPEDYEFVLQQWVKVRECEKGLGLLGEMRSRGFVPSCFCCNVLLRELFKCKKWDLGWELFCEMRDGWIDVVDTETFNVVMKVACVGGRMEEALEIFGLMKERDCMPDLDSFNIMIKGLSEKGDTEKICALFKQMLDLKVKPDSYTMNLLIKELCKQGRPECGNDLFNYMRKVGWLDRKFVYTQLVDSLCNYGWWLKGLKIFIKMVRRGHHPKVGVYANLVRCLCMGGRITEAFKLKDLIAKKEFMPENENYSCLIEGVCLAGRVDMADKLLREFQRKGLDPDLRMLNALLHGHCMLADVAKTLELLEKIRGKGWAPDLGPCNNLITSLVNEGKVEDAMRVKNCISTDGDITCSTDAFLTDQVNKLNDVEVSINDS